MNYSCPNKQYVPPSRQSSVYQGGVLMINNKPFRTLDYSLYLSHTTGNCSIIKKWFL